VHIMQFVPTACKEVCGKAVNLLYFPAVFIGCVCV
jgi:hypothetical protein